jgi:hypothetical protein
MISSTYVRIQSVRYSFPFHSILLKPNIIMKLQLSLGAVALFGGLAVAAPAEILSERSVTIEYSSFPAGESPDLNSLNWTVS